MLSALSLLVTLHRREGLQSHNLPTTAFRTRPNAGENGVQWHAALLHDHLNVVVLVGRELVPTLPHRLSQCP